jgi:choline kinase
MRQIILAAGRGTRLAPLTDDRPKCMVELSGRPLIERQLEAVRSAGINDIVLVGGYRADQLPSENATLIVNDAFETTNMVYSLFCARDHFTGGFIMSYGDIVFSRQALNAVWRSEDDIAVAIDRQWRTYWQDRFENPLDDAETLRLGANGNIIEIGQKPKSIDEIEGQYIGLVKFSAQGVSHLERAFAAAETAERGGGLPFGGSRPFGGLYMTDLLQGMIDMGIPVRPAFIDGGWLEVDSPSDLTVAAQRIAAIQAP